MCTGIHCRGRAIWEKKGFAAACGRICKCCDKGEVGTKWRLSQYINKSSALAAIEYIVSLNSNVFVPSHGGKMGRAVQVSDRDFLY